MWSVTQQFICVFPDKQNKEYIIKRGGVPLLIKCLSR